MPVVCPINLSSPVYRDKPNLLGFNEPEADLSRILLEELQHRIRNDLQGILSCIEREQRQTTNAQEAGLLDELMGRIWCLAGIYDLLHVRSHGLVDLGEYFLLLCTRIRTGKGLDSSRITLDAEVVSVPASLDRAVIMGMIVNELTTNAIKHAFAEGTGGRVSVQLRPAGTRLELVVRDNGRTSSEADIGGKGLHLVRRLAALVGATPTCEYAGGTGLAPGIQPNTGSKSRHHEKWRPAVKIAQVAPLTERVPPMLYRRDGAGRVIFNRRACRARS